MTVRVVGPWCIECQQRPALAHGLCSACDRSARTWWPHGLEPTPVMSVHDPGFELELARWREGKS